MHHCANGLGEYPLPETGRWVRFTSGLIQRDQALLPARTAHFSVNPSPHGTSTGCISKCSKRKKTLIKVQCASLMFTDALTMVFFYVLLYLKDCTN